MIGKGEKGNCCGGFRFTFFFLKDNNNGRQKAKTRDINYTDGSFWGRKVFERLLKFHTVVGCTSYSYHLPDPEDGHNATPQHGTKPYGSNSTGVLLGPLCVGAAVVVVVGVLVGGKHPIIITPRKGR